MPETSPKFLELIMLNAQQASLFMGQFPGADSEKAPVNLDASKMIIDHLEAIKEKTQGNLSDEEAKLLKTILADLQMAFVQAVSQKRAASGPENIETKEPVSSPAEGPKPEALDDESRKRFTKSYGS